MSQQSGQVQAFIVLGSEMNVIHSGFAKKLGLKTQATNVRAQKIDLSKLDTFEIVIASF